MLISEKDKILTLRSKFYAILYEIERIENAFNIQKLVIADAMEHFDQGKTIHHKELGKTIDYTKLDTDGVLKLLPNLKKLAWEAKRVFIKDISIEDLE